MVKILPLSFYIQDDVVKTRRNIYQIKPQLSAGPGVLYKALGLSTTLTGTSLLKKIGQIWIEDRGLVLNQKTLNLVQE